MGKLDFIYARHSVRKFTDQQVPKEDLITILQAAAQAPSGKNLQNWHYMVITNPEKILGVVEVIKQKNAELAEKIRDEKLKKKFTASLRFQTFIKNAPVLILVYAGPYEPTAVDVLEHIGASSEEIHALYKSAPGIQNIGAGIENLMLAAADMGYGTCWMTGPNYAAQEITKYVGMDKEGYYFAAMTPLGVPEEGQLTSPPRKAVEEIVTFID